MKTKTEIKRKYQKNKPLINHLVNIREQPHLIVKALGLEPEEVFNSTFESCSYVIALNDKKTIIEVCYSPEMILISSELNEHNPLWKKT